MRFQELNIRTKARTELVDITAQLQKIVQESTVDTTAALAINENADPSVQHDILAELNRLIPFAGPYQHTEGNSAAHIKSTFIGPSQTLFIEGGKIALGTWQGVYFCEFDGPRARKVWAKIIPG